MASSVHLVCDAQIESLNYLHGFGHETGEKFGGVAQFVADAVDQAEQRTRHAIRGGLWRRHEELIGHIVWTSLNENVQKFSLSIAGRECDCDRAFAIQCHSIRSSLPTRIESYHHMEWRWNANASS